MTSVMVQGEVESPPLDARIVRVVHVRSADRHSPIYLQSFFHLFILLMGSYA